jgi:hypothetical protein
VPFVSEVIEQVSEVVVQVRPPGLDVTVYESAPTEATHDTVADASPATAVTALGTTGANALATGVNTKDSANTVMTVTPR